MKAFSPSWVGLGRVFLLLLTLLFYSGKAFAQGDDMARAKEAFTNGQTYFESDQFELALKAFQSSFDSFPHFRTIFNIALCYERMENIPNAVEMYERYLNWSEEVPHRADVEKKVAQLKAMLPEDHESLNSSVSGDDKDEETVKNTGKDLRVPGWIAVGSGVAAAAVGGIFLGMASSKKAEMDSIKNEVYDAEKHDAIVEDGKRFEKIGWIVGGTGVAILTAGMIMLLISDKPEKADSGKDTVVTEEKVALLPKASLGVAADGVFVGAGWSF